MNAPTHHNSFHHKKSLMIAVLVIISAMAIGIAYYALFGFNSGQPAAADSAQISEPVASNPAVKLNEPFSSLEAAYDNATLSTTADHTTSNSSTSQTDLTYTDAAETTDIARDNQAMQTQYLHEALPDNDMIPFERTQQEAEAMIAQLREHSELTQKIEAGEATAEDQMRLYELRASKLEDEIELIRLCQDVQANSLDLGEQTAPTLCANATANSEQRLQELEEMLAELEKKYW